MKKLLKIIREWLDAYEDDVTFTYRVLQEQHKK